MGKNHVMNGQHIALVEQEICVPSAVFLRSGPSSWSLAVFLRRLELRRSQEVAVGVTARDELVIEALLSDALVEELQCLFAHKMKRLPDNETAETHADEYPDGWLDLDACEGHVGRGGQC